VATRPGRLARQSHVIAEAARVDRIRLLQWTLAFCALSAVWALDEGESPQEDLTIATLADAELGALATRA
jgi:streptomycin 6-kinase